MLTECYAPPRSERRGATSSRGFGDQRAIELLLKAEFTPVQPIRIPTLEGAIIEELAAPIGSIAPARTPV